jgi:hypothetical protein
VFLEKHFTLRQLEERTGINYHTLRRKLSKAPGVVNLKTRTNNCIRVPESVWERIYEEWMNEADHERPARIARRPDYGAVGVHRFKAEVRSPKA